MIKPKRKVELPPKFEIAQLIALQLGVGLVVLYYILKSEEVKDIFKDLPHVLLIIRIANALCGFACIVVSGGKLVTFYNDLKSFIEHKKKEQEKDE